MRRFGRCRRQQQQIKLRERNFEISHVLRRRPTNALERISILYDEDFDVPIHFLSIIRLSKLLPTFIAVRILW